MRFVVVGAGAVGGVVGGRMAQHGADVVLVARGEHGRVIAERGLTIESGDGHVVVRPPVAETVADVGLAEDDVVLLAVKSQDTAVALDQLRAATELDLPIVCLQNGVANEPAALRLFPDVYGVCVMCPSGYLEPGVVQAQSSPVAAILDIGRFPSGLDDRACEVAEAFQAATLVSTPRRDIMRWKYAKLLMNLLNAVDALFAPGAASQRIVELARAEGEAVLRAAGIEHATKEEDDHRRGDILQRRPIDGRASAGSSSWQSLARGAGTIESDYLNGEIVLLARHHLLDAPVNARLQQWARRAAARGDAPGAADAAAFLAELGG